jgi:hypothetical protein
MQFLKIYIIGVLVCFLIAMLMEHLYFGNGKSKTVKFETIGMDFIFSLMSWIGILGEIIVFVAEWYCGFDNKGLGEKLYNYEENLKNEVSEKEEGSR